MTDAHLRRPEDPDAAGIFAVHGDPRVWTLDPAERHEDVEDTRRFMQPRLEHWAAHGFGYWTVTVPRAWWTSGVASPEDQDEHRVVAGLGGIELRSMAGREVLNVYYRFAPEVHGRGLAGRVVEASIATAAARAPGVDLVVRTRPGNAAARRVAERAGFVDEGLEPGDDSMQLLRLAR